MKKRLYLLVLLLFCWFGGYAQNFPLNAKFIFYSTEFGLHDTVWVGCDTSATVGEGYDPDFDVVDSVFKRPLGILTHDSDVQNTYNIKTCGNLRKDVKGFVSGLPIGGPLYGPFVDYNLMLVIHDSILKNRAHLYLKWDTIDFKIGKIIFLKMIVLGSGGQKLHHTAVILKQLTAMTIIQYILIHLIQLTALILKAPF
jgi:hypothetical protein